MFGGDFGDDVPVSHGLPSVAHFLQQAMLNPRQTDYKVTAGVVAQLYRSLWTGLFNHVSPARLLPREIAQSTMHALIFLEGCNWNLCTAQKRAITELRERKREQLGGVASTIINSPSHAAIGVVPHSPTSTLSSASSSTTKGRFVTPRSATPPPGFVNDDYQGAEYGEDRKGVPCGHVFRKGEAIYRCRDCALDDTCVLCAPCFNSSEHEGHDIVFSVSSHSGGCCDCGDEEAWTRRIRCKYHDADNGGSHPAQTRGTSKQSGSPVDDMDQDRGDAYMDHYSNGKGKGPDRSMSSLDYTTQVEGLLVGIPPAERDAILQQVSILTNFILEMLEHAPDDMKLPEGPDAIESLKRQPTLEPVREDEDDVNLYNVMAGAYSFDPVQSKRMYSVILWNDEKHSFREVIDIVCEATDKSEIEAKAIAERIDKHGREIIHTSSEVRKLYLLAHKLGQIDLAVTIRPAYDVFAEEIAGHILNFLLDLVNASFYVAAANGATAEATHPLDQVMPSTVAMRALVGRALLDPWRPRNAIAQGQMSSAYFDPSHLTQLDGMLLMDHKLWKAARADAKSVYLALIGPREIKRAITQRFACMFAKLVEIFILHDREPEHSIRFIAVQLFSVPSIATELVSTSDFLQKLFDILQAIFTSSMASGALMLPPKRDQRMQVSPSSMLLRQQRCHHVLYDLRYLLSAIGVQKQIVANARHLGDFVDFLTIFNAVTPDRRAVSEHVEFESEIWVPIFHVATHVARTAKLFGEAYVNATEEQLSKSLEIAMSLTHRACLQLHEREPEVYAKMAMIRHSIGGTSYDVVEYEVETMATSFHHPLHWLLAEMYKSIGKVGSESRLREVTQQVGANEALVIFDFPLRVVVKLAQIRAGMWVRNGFGIRSQAHHYRDNSMRDVMYDQDLYMVQCALVMVEADRMLVNIASRFSLLEWLQNGRIPNNIERDQALCLAEELLLLLVTLLSETSMATNASMDRQVRREIIHFLALNQGTYSELTRHMSDKMKDYANFDRILSSVSKYRAPDGTNDLGIFELRDECFDEVQPFFFHYSRNQREKAEQVLKDRLKRKHPSASAIIAPSSSLSTGQNAFIDTLRRIFNSRILILIVFGCLKNVSQVPEEAPDGLLDGALQIMMLGLVEMPHSFARLLADFVLGAEDADVEKNTAIGVLLAMRKESKLSNFKPKIEWVLETSSQQDPERCGRIVAQLWKSSTSTDGQPSLQTSEAEKRKAAAKARQAAIMQQFSAQQKSLLESFEDDEDDEDKEEDDGGMDDVEVEGSAAEAKSKVVGNCIFCQEDLKSGQTFGSLAHIQNSRMVRTTPRHDPISLQQVLQTPLSLDRGGTDGKRDRGQPITPSSYVGSATRFKQNWDGYSAEDKHFGFYTSTCGHLMHLQCFDVYCRSTEQRHAQQIARNHPEDPSRSEFVCPLCKSLGNVILPVPLGLPERKQSPQDPLSISDWIRRINIEILRTSASSLRSDLQETEHGTGCFVPWFAEDAQGVLDAWLARESGLGSNGRDGLPNVSRQILERLSRVLRPLSTKSRSMRSALQTKTILAPPSRKMYIPEEVVGYTISVLEIAQRGQRPPSTSARSANVSDALSEQTMDLIVSLITCLRDIARVEEPNYQLVLKHGLLMRLLPHWGGHDTVRSPLLLREPITILVEAAAIVPENLGYVTILMFYVTLIQVVFGVAQPSLWPQSGSAGHGRGLAGLRSAMADDAHPYVHSDADTLKEVFDDVRGTVANIIGLVGYARGNITLGVDNLDDAGLAKMICTYCLPFLRRAAIIQRCMGILPSSVNGVNEEPGLEALNGEPSEFVRLMRLLSIPMPREALSATTTRQTALAGLVEGWIKHAYPQLASIFRPLPIQPSPLSSSSSIKQGGPHHHPMLQLEHPHIYELIRLPSNLTTLLTQSQAVKCKSCGNTPSEPAICLECGEMLCFQSFCCGNIDGRGECNQHLEQCGYASGMFFKIKSNIIVLLFQGKGSFTFSPYLDTHGEIDIGLRKGKIQYLHQVRFDELRKQWLQHGLANIITRKIEAMMDQGGWTTM